MGVREGLLTLLAGEAKHGYQLKQEFEAATGEAGSLNIGQVYTTLRRLERDGLAEADSADAEGRQAYRLTRAGRAAVDDWLTEAVPPAVARRDEVAMKILLAVATDVCPPLEVAAVQRRSTMTALQDFTHIKADGADEELAWRLHVDRLILQAEAEIRWLDLVEERLIAAGHEPSPVRHDARSLEGARPVEGVR